MSRAKTLPHARAIVLLGALALAGCDSGSEPAVADGGTGCAHVHGEACAEGSHCVSDDEHPDGVCLTPCKSSRDCDGTVCVELELANGEMFRACSEQRLPTRRDAGSQRPTPDASMPAPPAALGELCDPRKGGEDCETGTCAPADLDDTEATTGVCAISPGNPNFRCGSDQDCLWGVCDSGTGLCRPASIGHACHSDVECVSMLCAQGRCQCAPAAVVARFGAPQCATTSDCCLQGDRCIGAGPASPSAYRFGTCAACFDANAPCESNADCCSGNCMPPQFANTLGTCTAPACKRDYKGCADASECCSGICGNGLCGVCEADCEAGCGGSDGCGGTCGCALGQVCSARACVAAESCSPTCDGVHCGQADGCGGTCPCESGGDPGPGGVAAGSCHDRNACAALEAYAPRTAGSCDGEATGFITNTCSQAIECVFVFETGGHLQGEGETDVASGARVGGEYGGIWSCGLPESANFLVKCSDPDDPYTCRAFK